MRHSKPDWRTAFDALEAGNWRHVRGEQSNGKRRPFWSAAPKPIAAIICPPALPVEVEAVFDADPGTLYVIQTDPETVGADLAASLEWGVFRLGISLVVLLGNQAPGATRSILDHFASDWTTRDLAIVDATLGPDGHIRWEVLRASEPAQSRKSRKIV